MFADSLFRDKVALVTGGGTGLGFAIARRLGGLGARIVIASRNPARLDAGVKMLAGDAVEAMAVQADVRQPDQVERMVDQAVERFGRVDILVNSAAGNFICRAEDLSPNGWNAVVGIVLNGSFYCSRAAGRHMIARGGGGSIVSILATYAWTGSAGTVHSAAAKAGVTCSRSTAANGSARVLSGFWTK